MQSRQPHSNQELSALLQAGGQDGFALIYRQLWPELLDAAYKRLKDFEKAQDIVQTVFTDLWFRKEKLQIDNIEAYLHTAVRFQVYKAAAESHTQAPLITTLEDLLQSPLHADDKIVSSELQELVVLWIRALPRKRREIFLLRYQDQLSTKEIASLLKISQKTVQNQLNTATTDLQSRLSPLVIITMLVSSQA